MDELEQLRRWHIPVSMRQGIVKVVDKQTKVVAYLGSRVIEATQKTIYGFVVFAPKASKPTKLQTFWTQEERDKRVQSIFESWQAHDNTKKARRAKRFEAHTLKVGDILYTSWGYDQTNVDFYKVTELVGKNSVKIRQLKNENITGDGGWTGTCVPSDDFRAMSAEVTKRVNQNRVKISDGRYYASLWDGQPKSFSTYA